MPVIKCLSILAVSGRFRLNIGFFKILFPTAEMKQHFMRIIPTKAVQLLFCCVTGFLTPVLQAQEDEAKARLDAHGARQRALFTMLAAYAQDNHQALPDELGDSNANFRFLFMRRLIDDERLLAVQGDPWILPDKPDGDIGVHPSYKNAGTPGEVSFTYVAGRTSDSRPDLPLLLSGADQEATRWITGFSRKAPDKPFTGKVVVTFMSAETKVLTPDADGKIRLPFNGVPTDIFSPAYGTNPASIRLPAIPKKAKDAAAGK